MDRANIVQAVRTSRFVSFAAATCAAVLVAACGSKTGLDTPDVAMDAATDGPAPMPDANATDAPADARPPTIVCLAPQPDGGLPLTTGLDVSPQVSVADVVFVVDRTGSMQDEIDNLTAGLNDTIVRGLLRTIPDVYLGLVTFADFPVLPYGDTGDIPYTLEQPLSDNYTALQNSLSNVVAGGGADDPESQVEALYQTATGAGLPNGSWGGIPPSGGCPRPGNGYPCFRPSAQPVIIMATDAPFHNGPSMDGGAPLDPYDPAAFQPYPAPHSYPEMIGALNTLGVHFIGINCGGLGPLTGRADLMQVAQDTRTTGTDGQPLIFDIDPDGALSDNVVAAIQQFTSQVPFDVSATAEDLTVPGASMLISGIVPQAASPMGNIARMDATTFYTVIPGTHLSFAIEFDPMRLVQTDHEQQYPVRIQFLGDGRPTLGYQDLVIVIPALGSTVCT